MIFHLTVIILLLVYQIDNTIRREESFVLDFSKQEEIERREKEEVMKQDISRKLEDMIEAARRQTSGKIRNIAVPIARSMRCAAVRIPSSVVCEYTLSVVSTLS